jgi:hypothetical protein
MISGILGVELLCLMSSTDWVGVAQCGDWEAAMELDVLRSVDLAPKSRDKSGYRKLQEENIVFVLVSQNLMVEVTLPTSRPRPSEWAMFIA